MILLFNKLNDNPFGYKIKDKKIIHECTSVM